MGDDNEIEREIEKVIARLRGRLRKWVTDLGLSVDNRGHTRV